jgi:hypothetical protein
MAANSDRGAGRATKFIFVTGGVLSSLGKGLGLGVDRGAARGARPARHLPQARSRT